MKASDLDDAVMRAHCAEVLRCSRNITPATLAEASGVPRSVCSRWLHLEEQRNAGVVRRAGKGGVYVDRNQSLVVR